MPITSCFTGETIEFHTVGDVDYAAGFEVLNRAIQEARTRTTLSGSAHWHLLFDIRASTEQRSVEEVWDIARFIAIHRAVLTGQCAIVALGERYVMLTKAFGSFVEKADIRIGLFDSLETARSWLQSGDLEAT